VRAWPCPLIDAWSRPWYVYTALTKLVDGDVDIVVSLINRDDFIHPDTDDYGFGAFQNKPTTTNYELTTVRIHPDNLENASAQTCPRLITGFF
jgi:hypothetical protein